MDLSYSQKSPCAEPPLDENMYVVDKILKKRTFIKNGKNDILYYVRWEGYPDPADHTWEPLENLMSVPQMVEDFEKRLAEKQRRDHQEENRKREQRKREDKFEVKHNNPDFRKFQNSANESEEPPHKQLKTKEELSNLIFDKKRSSNDIKEVFRPTSDSGFKKEKDKQIEKNERSDHNAIVRDKLEAKEKKFPAPLAKDENRKELRYGRVVNHIYRDGELCYQIERISKDKVKRVQQISSKKASEECLANAYQYLQKLVTNLQENLEK